jgi:hypothetical protein
MTALSSPNASTHAFDVLIKPETEGNVSAIGLGLPEYRATGSDRTSALYALYVYAKIEKPITQIV